MLPPPETRYATSGDVAIAYQVVGSGPLDLLMVPGWISNLDMQWEDPAYQAWVERLASFARLILLDKRGCGLSDRDVGDSTLEDRMDDLRAVMDAVGSRRAAVYGLSEGGPLSVLFAATHPDRVHSLVLCAAFPRILPAPDYPEGAVIKAALDRVQHITETAWGQGGMLPLIAPALAASEFAQRYMQRYERASLSPRAARAHLPWVYEIDVRPVARALHVPTLVLHAARDQLVPVEGGRWFARNVPNARYVELDDDAHVPWLGEQRVVADEIREFLTGSRGEEEPDRVLATVLFTDVVDSTRHLARLGDAGWGDLRARHLDTVRREIARHRGVQVNQAGDGVMATFDGPARAVRCAVGIREGSRPLGLEVRAGVHIGECERRGDEVLGIAVHTAARVMASAEPSEVLVSSTVKDLVAGSGLRFADRGRHALKGIPGDWQLYGVA